MPEAADSHIVIGTIEDNPSVSDWAQHIEDAMDDLPPSGNGDLPGTLTLTDNYPLDRTLVLSPRTFLRGNWNVSHHQGSSPGLHVNDQSTFVGDWVVEWEDADDGNYSNFGAGVENIHVTGYGDLGGVKYRGAQQAAGLTNLFVRGFCPLEETGTRIGLQVGRDTWSGTNIFLDPGTGPSFTRSGATGLYLGSAQAYSLTFRNVTVHNCQEAVRWNNLQSCRFDNLETEICEWPLVQEYNSSMLTFDTCSFRHTDNLIDMRKTKWYDTTSIRLSA